jgi:hypothetical protein
MAKNEMKAGMKPQRARNKFLREERERKAAEAAVRKELREKRTAAQQLAKLDAGGFVAKKERAKLAKLLSAVSEVLVDMPPEVVEAAEAAEAAKASKKSARKAKGEARKGKK